MSEFLTSVRVDRHPTRWWRRYLAVVVLVEVGRAAGGLRTFMRPAGQAHTRWGARRLARRAVRQILASR